MRRVVFLLLSVVLVWLVAARGALPEPAEEVMAAAVWDSGDYNILDWDLSGMGQTAGSAFVAEMDRHFLSCPPTAKHSRTGLLAGQNLVLVLADSWHTEQISDVQTPALYSLWRDGVQFAEVYAPDWYQGREGREFALLTGLTPTTVQNRTSMSLLAGQNIYLPFALANRLKAAGYTCRVYAGTAGQEAAYEALGLSPADGSLSGDLAALGEKEPFFAYTVWEETDGEAAAAELVQALEKTGLADSTAVCVCANGTAPLRGALFLRAGGLEAVPVPAPCSELDVTPTLLDLFGAAYDSRFLSGRDVLADGSGGGPLPLVSLYGSAYSDWVTDAGSYAAAEDVFFPVDSRFGTDQEQDRYVLRARQAVYDKFVYSRRILESNYFRLATFR